MKRATLKNGEFAYMISISIHALVKRATLQNCSTVGRRVNFNPRPREEGDLSLCNGGRSLRHFNPRPREEGDKCFIKFILFSTYFNPRPREEGDEGDGDNSSDDFISIHALVKRATIHPVNFCCWKLISIHALVKRATTENYYQNR